MRIFAGLMVIGFIIVGAGCSDSDVVPESHISAPPENPVSVEPETVEQFPLNTALFGDLHVHTSWSIDAYAGENRLGPNAAYRFAKGEKVTLQTGEEAQLQAPLDFVALTDHAEGFEMHLPCTMMPDSPEFSVERCQDVRSGDFDLATMLDQAFATAGVRPQPRVSDICGDDARCKANEVDTWQRVQAVANAHNAPGRFTALIGYEFSSLLPEMGMLHRNVIFRGEEVTPHAISAIDVSNQKEFFDQLDAACEAPCEVLTIPHNTNYSWGLMFSRADEDGSAFTNEDLEKRVRIERLFELTQQKGTSECHLSIGATDEDCGFGNMFAACEAEGDLRCATERSFLRNILLDGLALEEERALNPYKLGVIGSTDTHTSDPGNTRSGIPARFKPAEGIGFAVNRLLEADHPVAGPIRRFLPGGLAGVWAEENTRESIYNAFRRKETFGTSGPRIKVRFFAGYNFENSNLNDQDLIQEAYSKNVPMGGDIIQEKDKNPRFLVWAISDPLGAPLQRVQIIKGWLADGEQREKVFDVACSDGQSVNPLNHRCPDNGAKVNLDDCSISREKGNTEIKTFWQDPEFSNDQEAFYYARVLENPTCRWSTWDAVRAEEKPRSDIPVTIQERAWSSPIWIKG